MNEKEREYLNRLSCPPSHLEVYEQVRGEEFKDYSGLQLVAVSSEAISRLFELSDDAQLPVGMVLELGLELVAIYLQGPLYIEKDGNFYMVGGEG